MTHPIDAAKAYVRKTIKAVPNEPSFPFARETLTLLTQPDPRVTALVEAVEWCMRDPYEYDWIDDMKAALAPFLKDESDAN